MRVTERVYTMSGWALVVLGFVGSVVAFLVYTVASINGDGAAHGGTIRIVAVMVALVIVLGVWLLWAGVRRAAP